MECGNIFMRVKHTNTTVATTRAQLTEVAVVRPSVFIQHKRLGAHHFSCRKYLTTLRSCPRAGYAELLLAQR